MPRQSKPKCPSCRRVKCKCVHEDMEGGFLSALVSVGRAAANIGSRAAALGSRVANMGSRAASNYRTASAAAKTAKDTAAAAAKAASAAKPGSFLSRAASTASKGITTVLAHPVTQVAMLAAAIADPILQEQKMRDLANKQDQETAAAVEALEKQEADNNKLIAQDALDRAAAKLENDRLTKEAEAAIAAQIAAAEIMKEEARLMKENYEAWKKSQEAAADQDILAILNGYQQPAPPQQPPPPPVVIPTPNPPPPNPPPVQQPVQIPIQQPVKGPIRGKGKGKKSGGLVLPAVLTRHNVVGGCYPLRSEGRYPFPPRADYPPPTTAIEALFPGGRFPSRPVNTPLPTIRPPVYNPNPAPVKNPFPTIRPPVYIPNPIAPRPGPKDPIDPLKDLFSRKKPEGPLPPRRGGSKIEKQILELLNASR